VEYLPAKEGSSKKREKEKKEREKKKKGARIKKQKRWNHIWRSSMFPTEKRKKKDEIYKLKEILSNERKEGYHIFL
jgi:hypothetical protein